MQSKNQVRSDFHFNDSASVPSPYLSDCGDFASRRNTACFLLLIRLKNAVAELHEIFDFVEAEMLGGSADRHALASGASDRKVVWVQVPSPAPRQVVEIRLVFYC